MIDVDYITCTHTRLHIIHRGSCVHRPGGGGGGHSSFMWAGGCRWGSKT